MLTLQLSGGTVSFTETGACKSRPLQLVVRRPDLIAEKLSMNHGQLRHHSEKGKARGT